MELLTFDSFVSLSFAHFGWFNMLRRILLIFVTRSNWLFVNTKSSRKFRKQAAVKWTRICFNVWHMSCEMDSHRANGMQKCKIKLNNSIIMNEMLNESANGFLGVFDAMQTRIQFWFFFHLSKWIVNQFIYPKNLQPMILDNSNHPNRTPASTFCISFCICFFCRRHHHHHRRFVYPTHPKIRWIILRTNVRFFSLFRWDRQILVMVVFLWFCTYDSIFISLHPWNGIWNYIHGVCMLYVVCVLNVHACIIKLYI